MFSARQFPRIELLLWQADGQPWSVSFSPGIERFIGAYPRLDGIDAGGPLLEYRAVAPIG
jgi:hypothetical protein